MSKTNLKPLVTLREPAELLAHGFVPTNVLANLEKVAARYAVAVTPDMAALIDPGDPDDPIARQFIPSAQELVVSAGENADPIGDHTHSPVPGIVHRYPDRVLFKLVHVCAVYCRFCFRREMVGPGKETALAQGAYQNAIDYIRSHSEIWEVILTGGDPLMLSPRRLAEVMADIAGDRSGQDNPASYPRSGRRPRAHQRRYDRGAEGTGATTWVALHANHARELTEKARAACAAIIDAGIPMVSQSVLLRGVNDNAAALEALMRAFVECRIKPYYLHHGDLAPGTAHLRTSLDRGQELMRALRGRVSGLCQPDYVLDIPGGHGKSPVGPAMSRRQILYRGIVNPMRKRAIVLRITAATSICILRIVKTDDRRSRVGAGATGGPRQSQRRECSAGGVFRRAGGGGNLVAGHDGRYTKGARLRRPGTPELRDDHGTRPSAMKHFSDMEKADATPVQEIDSSRIHDDVATRSHRRSCRDSAERRWHRIVRRGKSVSTKS